MSVGAILLGRGDRARLGAQGPKSSGTIVGRSVP
jgi:hypothetical protein